MASRNKELFQSPQSPLNQEPLWDTSPPPFSSFDWDYAPEFPNGEQACNLHGGCSQSESAEKISLCSPGILDLFSHESPFPFSSLISPSPSLSF